MQNSEPWLNDLGRAYAHAWDMLGRASVDRRHAMHMPVVANVDDKGLPQQRVMVLRAADRSQAILRFHTDARSPKAGQIAQGAPVSVLAYDQGAKIQLRLQGHGRIETTSDVAEHAWQAATTLSRRCYLAVQAPGADAAGPTSGLPQQWENARLEEEDTLPGRANFCVLLVKVRMIDWLYLASTGHRRARFDEASCWQGQWLIP